MKPNLLFLTLALLLAGSAYSQEKSFGLVVRAVNENARTADQFSWLVGLDAGVQFDGQKEFGLYASMAPFGYYPAGYDDPDEYQNYLEMAGLYLRLPIGAPQTLNTFFQLKAGYGNLAIGEDNATYFTDHTFYVVQPSLGFSYPLTKSFSIAFDLHYRHGGPLDLYVYKFGSVSGTGISLQFAYCWR